MVVGRIGGRLDHEHVGPADVFKDFDEDFHVGEAPDTGLGRGQFEPGGDFLGQHRVRVAGYELDGAVLGRHRRFSPQPGGYNIQHIENPRYWRALTSEVISRRWLGWQPVARGFPAQKRDL
jgi:hypothetical protein